MTQQCPWLGIIFREIRACVYQDIAVILSVIVKFWKVPKYQF